MEDYFYHMFVVIKFRTHFAENSCSVETMVTLALQLLRINNSVIQVLNNRIFDGGEPKTKTTSIVTNGNAVNGNLKDEGESTDYKFTLPADEEGIVYQCHLCSFTATARAAFNTHVNTHYDFQCVKCDFEVKVSVSTIYQSVLSNY